METGNCYYKFTVPSYISKGCHAVLQQSDQLRCLINDKLLRITHRCQAWNSSNSDIKIWTLYDYIFLNLTAPIFPLWNIHEHLSACMLARMLWGTLQMTILFCCPTFGVEQFVAIRIKNSPTLCLCVFLLVWWSCQLPLAALQITKSSLTCWLLSQRRFMPCQTQQYQTATSRPWLRCVTWRTESWWWTSAGLNISQVGKWTINIKHVQDMHACCLTCWSEPGTRYRRCVHFLQTCICTLMNKHMWQPLLRCFSAEADFVLLWTGFSAVQYSTVQ